MANIHGANPFDHPSGVAQPQVRSSTQRVKNIYVRTTPSGIEVDGSVLPYKKDGVYIVATLPTDACLSPLETASFVIKDVPGFSFDIGTEAEPDKFFSGVTAATKNESKVGKKLKFEPAGAVHVVMTVKAEAKPEEGKEEGLVLLMIPFMSTMETNWNE